MTESSMTPHFVCPFCKKELEGNDLSVVCRVCKRSYDSVLGIPDFRVGDHVSRDSDMLCDLVEKYDSLDFEGLSRLHYEMLMAQRQSVSKGLIRHWLKYREESRDRGASGYAMVEESMDRLSFTLGGEKALDLGCGEGPTLKPFSRTYDLVLGVEPSMESLVVARKRLEESGAGNVQLACAEAEALPFPDGYFDLVTSLNVIEHFCDQERSLGEISRVLKQDGFYAFDSPNRYNVFRPEPHVQIYWLGFIPRRWMSGVVKRLRGREYTDVRLLSYCELSRKLKTFFEEYWILFPSLEKFYAVKNGFILRAYRIVTSIPGVRFLFKLIFPLYQVVARK